MLDTLVASAAHLCDAQVVAIHVRHDNVFAGRARYGVPAEMVEALSRIGQVMGRGSLVGRTFAEGRPVNIPDATADPEYTNRDFTRIMGARSMLGVPLMRDGRPVGLLSLYRTRVAPFTPRQIELMATFADQAVIAIENARLFEEVQARSRELTEALEQQTATSEILGVISRSPTNVQPIFDAIVKSAVRLCDGVYSSVATFDGELLHLVANYNYTPEVARLAQKMYPRHPDRQQMLGRAILNRANVQIEDALADPEYPQHLARTGAWRGMLAVPMLRGENPIGAICVMRGYPGQFSETEIKLLETFADQAVIAIENARLFHEIADKSQQLELASQHKSQFVANMSHELRTPLAAILGYAELMQEGFHGLLPDKAKATLARIQSNGKHLLGLINSVLDISKIEAGQFSLNAAEYALDGMVETVRVQTESLATAKKLALNAFVATNLPHGFGDEPRLTQVLLNLVGNAIKFTDRGEVRITAGITDACFALDVSDTGPGIPPAERDKIFEEFHQVDNTSTRAKGGTGLGLAIAKQIVEMHGGRIWVESTVGKGSCFRIELPVRTEAAKRVA